MRSNKDLGYTTIAKVGNYSVGSRGNAFRAYGYEWASDQDASREQSHHEVCGRGATAEEAINNMISAAIVSGRTTEHIHNMQTVTGLSEDEAIKLRNDLIEAVAEATEE